VKIPQDQVDNLLRTPSEGLPVEIKTWIDPASPEGIAKIVRACLALRNQNGGFLIIGLNNQTLQVDTDGKPANVREAFHIDNIQQLVSRFAHDPFEIEIAFAERDRTEIPVIIIPDGVQYPAASKANHSGPGGKQFIRAGDVYCRTLNANGRASTALAQPKDWRDIFDRCFENREADIGRFLRRHLGPSAEKVLARLTQPSEPTLETQAVSFLDEGLNQFTSEASSRNLTGHAHDMANGGKFEASLIISPPKAGELPTSTFYQAFTASNPRLTGWPIWLDSSGFDDRSTRPFVSDETWQAFIVSTTWFRSLDFHLLDPNGRFYLLRSLQDDNADKIPPGKYLEPISAILHVAETIVVGLSFARALGWSPEEATLGFAFRWTGLKGRRLEPWGHPGAYLSSFGTSGTDITTSFVEVPLDTPLAAIAPAVETALRKLTIAFDGYQLPTKPIEEWTRRLTERRLF
jgi:hypothetical protein